MRGATAQIVDALPELGGQLTALYPEKYIFDVAGFPKVLAKDLVRMLAEQAHQFAPPIHLNQRVIGLEQEDGHFVLVTDQRSISRRARSSSRRVSARSRRDGCRRRAPPNGMGAESSTSSATPRRSAANAW